MAAWERNSGITLFPWEAATLRALSGAYLSEHRRAARADALPPWTFEPEKDRRAKIDRQFAALFASLSNRSKR
jgi:hypothetical protein